MYCSLGVLMVIQDWCQSDITRMNCHFITLLYPVIMFMLTICVWAGAAWRMAVGQWLTLSPHSKRVLGLFLSVWSLHVIPVSTDDSVSSHSPKTCRFG